MSLALHYIMLHRECFVLNPNSSSKLKHSRIYTTVMITRNIITPFSHSTSLTILTQSCFRQLTYCSRYEQNRHNPYFKLYLSTPSSVTLSTNIIDTRKSVTLTRMFRKEFQRMSRFRIKSSLKCSVSWNVNAG